MNVVSEGGDAGGGDAVALTYFKLGVGWCSYDASTDAGFEEW
jgi:hypothetical protein